MGGGRRGAARTADGRTVAWFRPDVLPLYPRASGRVTALPRPSEPGHQNLRVGKPICIGASRRAVVRNVADTTAASYQKWWKTDSLPPGTYVLRGSRIGFRLAVVEVELRGDGPLAGDAARVSVGLIVAPVVLPPVAVAAEAREPFARRARTARETADARTAALRARRARHLATDVREVTHADVEEGLSTAETDLFRALQRLPGVATRSDATAELWTRGGRWDQTRVTFDGLPLFNPLHAGGVLSAVNANAVGAAVLFPGVRPAAVGEGGAGVLDLRSRAGGGTGRVRGVGELSLFSARAALDQTVGGGRGAWMVAGRRSYLDVATRAAADPDDRIPYAVSEVVLRGDWHPGRAHSIEVSAFRSRDHIADRSAFDDPSPGAAPGATGSDWWGNTAARITHTGPATLGALGAVRLRHTAGVTAYGAARRASSAAPPCESS